MKVSKNFVLIAIFLSVFLISPVTAQDKVGSGEVFDLGDVLIMEKGDENNPVTTTDIISLDDIEYKGARTVADVLEQVPGIDVQVGSKGHQSLKLRGFEQRDVKVLIDGVPAHETYFGSLDLDKIPVDAIAKIKVVKGASSVLYGSNTMGGVINIITKKGGEKPFTSLTASFGENDTRNYVLNHGGSKGQINYWLTYSHRTSDGYELSDDFDSDNPRTGIGTEYNEDGGLRDLSHYTYNTLHAKLGYEYDADSKIYLSFDYHDNEKGCPTESERYWEFNEWKQWHINLVGEHDFTDMLTMKARVYYVKHDDTIKDVSWDDDHTTGRKWFEKSAYDDYTAGGELQAYLDFGDASLLKFGFSYMKDNHTQQDFYDADTMSVWRFGDPEGWQPSEEYETDIYSFAVEDEIKFGKLVVTGGFSYDIHDPIKAEDDVERDKEDTWNPQVGAAYNVSKDFKLHASVGKKTRFPQMQELYSDLAGGNESLKPQKTIAYEVGLSKDFDEFGELSVAVFNNDIEDRIYRNSDREYENAGESDINGLEVQWNIQTSWNLDLGIGYTYLDGEEKESDSSEKIDVQYMPDHKLTLDARYYFDFGLTCSLQTIYTGEQIEYDDMGEKYTIDDFVVVNARLNQDIKLFEKLKTDLFFEVKNLFDEDYEEGSGPMPGRSLLVGMTVSF